MIRADEADELVELATLAAKRAGVLLGEMAFERDNLRLGATSKSSRTDLVTAADLKSEAAILEVLLGARPSDSVLAEEGSSRTGTSGLTWVIDPLDGTTNFVYGFGSYAVSIAAKYGDSVVVGVVHDPVADETFVASPGRGATSNGALLNPSRSSSLPLALIGTGFGYQSSLRAKQSLLLPSLLPAVRDIRRGGSASLDCCSVAAGRLDAYFEAGLKPWDFAAGLLIATEAGCTSRLLDDFPEAETTLVIAGHDLIDPLVELLRSSGRTSHPDRS